MDYPPSQHLAGSLEGNCKLSPVMSTVTAKHGTSDI